MTPSAKSERAAWWRIVPKRKGRDVFVRKFGSRESAEEMLAIMDKRRTHKVVAYNREGKRLPDG